MNFGKPPGSPAVWPAMGGGGIAIAEDGNWAPARCATIGGPGMDGNGITAEGMLGVNLGRIKNRAGRFAGGERKGTNKIACRVLTVIDMEAAYTDADEKEPDPEKRQEVESDSGRLDLVVLSADQRLLTFEAKLFSNGELRAEAKPKVCGQLQDYHGTISARRDELVQAYANLLGIFASLRGSFFEKRVRHPNWAEALKDPASLTIDPIPRLLIFHYDGLQEPSLKATIARINEHVGIPGFDPKRHVRTLGKAASVNEPHLVLKQAKLLAVF